MLSLSLLNLLLSSHNFNLHALSLFFKVYFSLSLLLIQETCSNRITVCDLMFEDMCFLVYFLNCHYFLCAHVHVFSWDVLFQTDDFP